LVLDGVNGGGGGLPVEGGEAIGGGNPRELRRLRRRSGAEKFEAAALGRVGAAAKELDQQRARAVGLLLDLTRTKAARGEERSAVLMKAIGTLLFALILREKEKGQK
jgi:hypothetical protein